MPKPEWGAKHSCQSCGAKFYDLMRSPIVCPSCGTESSAEISQRGRRPRPVPAKVEADKAAEESASPDEATEDADQDDVEDIEDEVDIEAVETTDEALEDDPADGAGGDLIEDASELGEDDAMPSVAAGDEETES